LSEPAPDYTIGFIDDAKRDVVSLDGSIRKRLKKVLTGKLARDPEGYGTPLRGNLTGYWKHEFASHRIIYRIYQDKRLVVICAVGKRQGGHVSDVYQQLEAVVKAGAVARQIQTILKKL
jgi:mRNA interferase RelE/StbE